MKDEGFRDYRESHKGQDKGKKYDRNFQRLQYRNLVWNWEKEILRCIAHDIPGNGSYLDFACGTGRVLSFMESEGVIGTGVDVSESMLKVARDKVTSSKLLKLDITREHELRGQNFDLITAFRFFLNAQDQLRMDVIKELSKLLGEDGILVINIHNVVPNLGSTVTSLVIWIGKLLGRYYQEPGCMKKKDLLQILHVGNFEILKIYHFGILPVLGDKMILPKFLYKFIEIKASKMICFRNISKNWLLICRIKTTS